MIKNISSIKNPTVMQISALKTEGTKDAFLIEGEKFIGDTDPKNILKILFHCFLLNFLVYYMSLFKFS